MVIENRDDLFTNRIEAIRDLLQSISPNKNLNIKQLSSRSKIIYAVSDVTESGQDFPEWRFRTQTKNYYASYYEIWLPQDNTDYYLSKSYFHLYCAEEEFCRTTPGGEYLLLHCDPNEIDEAHGIYKKNPHLHVKTAKHPLPHAHIALNLYSADQIYANIIEFTKSMKQSIEMIDNQIIKKIDA